MDNRYFTYGCPALMQDKRFITNYIRGRVYDQYIRKINNIDSSMDYKLFLQQNTETILNRERNILNDLHTCNTNKKCLPLSEYESIESSCNCTNACKYKN
jgi:hypothetical protein